MGLRNRSVAKRDIKEIKQTIKDQKEIAKHEAEQNDSFSMVQVAMFAVLALAAVFYAHYVRAQAIEDSQSQ